MNKKSNDKYSYKDCKILNYIKQTNTLLVYFDGLGISFIIDNIDTDTVKVKYSGKINTKNFICELVR